MGLSWQRENEQERAYPTVQLSNLRRSFHEPERKQLVRAIQEPLEELADQAGRAPGLPATNAINWCWLTKKAYCVQIFNNSLASVMPGAGRPYSLAVTRASATS